MIADLFWCKLVQTDKTMKHVLVEREEREKRCPQFSDFWSVRRVDLLKVYPYMCFDNTHILAVYIIVGGVLPLQSRNNSSCVSFVATNIDYIVLCKY